MAALSRRVDDIGQRVARWPALRYDATVRISLWTSVVVVAALFGWGSEFAAMIGSFAFACGAGAKEKILERTRPPMIDEDEDEDDNDRGSISLGWLVHAAMSAKARIMRMGSECSAVSSTSS